MELALTLLMLVMLQAVLGFDNLLYISLESKRAPKENQAMVRKVGIGLAVILRICLLFLVVKLVASLDKNLFDFDIGNGSELVSDHGAHSDEAHAEVVAAPEADADHAPSAVDTAAGAFRFHGAFNFESIIFLLGGLFILYTAIKEIWHLIGAEIHGEEQREPTAPWKVITMIVIMNLVFSFDSILSAMALSDNFYILATAILIGGILMVTLADKISVFLEKNRLYEVLGLFILFLVGVLLISEGAHKAHLVLFAQPIEAMSKATFYFVLAALVVVDVVQGRYQKKLIAKQRAQSTILKSEEAKVAAASDGNSSTS